MGGVYTPQCQCSKERSKLILHYGLESVLDSNIPSYYNMLILPFFLFFILFYIFVIFLFLWEWVLQGVLGDLKHEFTSEVYVNQWYSYSIGTSLIRQKEEGNLSNVGQATIAQEYMSFLEAKKAPTVSFKKKKLIFYFFSFTK